jgi:RHS repeat-associated protein
VGGAHIVETGDSTGERSTAEADWSPSGQKLGTYALTTTAQTYLYGMYYGPYFYATQTGTNYYFGSKLIKNAAGWVYSDRLGSIGKYYPYGTDKGSGNPASGEKFTGYIQDSETGLDYADQRYMQPGSGRFLTPDRLTVSVRGTHLE